VIVFPELSLTGYSCGDLFHTQTLRTQAMQALAMLADATAD
jgi:NAD+ synthase (glutamine-hydrolysing)